MPFARRFIVLVLLLVIVGSVIASVPTITEMWSSKVFVLLNLRSRVETIQGSGVWKEVVQQKWVRVDQTAILIIDMWDKHWCSVATERIETLAPVMNSVIEVAREEGVQIIHAPSRTMSYYKNDTHRELMKAFSHPAAPKSVNTIELPPLPISEHPRTRSIGYDRNHLIETERGVRRIGVIDKSTNVSASGCEYERPRVVWTKEHPSIEIKGSDVISDSKTEIYNFLKHKGITNLIVMGVHANVCVISGPVGVRNMLGLGFDVVLVRDLTDVIYSPQMPPYVSHDEALDMVVEYVEKYLCPSILSVDILRTYSERDRKVESPPSRQVEWCCLNPISIQFSKENMPFLINLCSIGQEETAGRAQNQPRGHLLHVWSLGSGRL